MRPGPAVDVRRNDGKKDASPGLRVFLSLVKPSGWLLEAGGSFFAPSEVEK